MTEAERQELIRARDDLQGQLYRVANPTRGLDRNPPLEAKLRSMLADIAELLANDAPSD
jgi:hypothetical protein